MIAITYPINAQDDNLPSRCITNGPAPNLPECSPNSPETSASSRLSLPSLTPWALLITSGASSGLLGLSPTPSYLRCSGMPSAAGPTYLHRFRPIPEITLQRRLLYSRHTSSLPVLPLLALERLQFLWFSPSPCLSPCCSLFPPAAHQHRMLRHAVSDTTWRELSKCPQRTTLTPSAV